MSADPGQPSIDWIINVPPAELAVELMAAFGAGEPRVGGPLGATELSDWMFRGYPKPTGFIVPARPVVGPIMEAAQLLEHSELIYLRWVMHDEPRWNITRLGTTLVADGKEAVRRRIRDRTGL